MNTSKDTISIVMIIQFCDIIQFLIFYSILLGLQYRFPRIKEFQHQLSKIFIANIVRIKHIIVW